MLQEEHGCAHILRAGLAIRDDLARTVLQRPRSTPVQPQCTKGRLGSGAVLPKQERHLLFTLATQPSWGR